MLWYRPIMDTEPAIPLTANRPRVPLRPPSAPSLPEVAATAYVAIHPTTLPKNCKVTNTIQFLDRSSDDRHDQAYSYRGVIVSAAEIQSGQATPSMHETGSSGQGKHQQGLITPRLVNERLTYFKYAPRSRTLEAEQVALWLRSGIQLWNKRGRRLHPSSKKACSSAGRHLYSTFRLPLD